MSAARPDGKLRGDLLRMRTECERELARITDWWLTHLPRPEGGYFGEISHSGTPAPETPVSAILLTRVLWFFSAAADAVAREDVRREADRVADWFHVVFLDKEHGGTVWSATPDGGTVDGRKHGYAQGFAIYALARHHRATGNARSLDTAKAVFRDLERHFRDPEHGGYREAFARDWQPLEDFRLSEKEGFAPKTMNTHLHILEAYTELCRVSREDTVLAALQECISLHLTRIWDPARRRLRLFMREDWRDISDSVSFGHDIEASWLLCEAAEVVGDAEILRDVQAVAVSLAEAVLEYGVGPEGEVFNGQHLQTGGLDRARIWWVQAEAIAGFLNAYSLSGREEMARAALDAWAFIQTHIIDPDGEWRWHSALDGAPDTYWAGPWKACYHNGRAMLEAIRRIDALTAL